jgi:hypothetical protein
MEDSKMDEINKSVPKTFIDRVSVRLRYVFTLTALVAVAAIGYSFLPEAEVSAQERGADKTGTESEAPEVATQMMLDFALNLHTASEYTVYAERGIVDRGGSTVRGNKGDAMRTAAGRKATKELSNSIDAIRQLPCTALRSADLTGKTFGPGVYCLDSAELAGEMTLDSGGSTTGEYVFRVAGALNVKGGSSIRLENGAQGGNVFFAADSAEIGDGAAFRASVLTKGDIRIGSDATMTDKVLAMGKVEMGNSALLGGTTGTMEICKEQQLPVTPANDLSNWIFNYTITGSVYTAASPLRVPVGSCSSPFDVTAGAQVVTELNTGQLINPPNGTFSGNFELIDVANLTPASTSSLNLVNLATRTANVTIVAGGVNTQLTLQFTNRRTITGYIEICKRAAVGAPVTVNGVNVEGGIALPGPGLTVYNPAGANPLSGGDPDVTGFFQYTIEDVYSVNQQNPPVKTLQIFTVPVGQCSGPIAVTKGDPAPSPPDPRQSLAFVSELPRAGFYLESIQVVPANRRNSADQLGFIVGVNNAGGDVLIPAPGGGFVDVIVQESTSTADETLVIFANRSNPGRVKVCKIAGPGIPINTLFTFTVVGYGQLNAVHPQVATYGIVTRTFDVRAGDPAQGGTCEFVPGVGANPPTWTPFQTFVNGTPVYVYENGISVNNTIPQNPGQLRVSRIRVDGSVFTNTTIAGFSPNPQLVPAAATNEQFQTTGPIPLADFATTNIPVNVPDAGLVADVNVSVRLDHTFDSDLQLSIFDPAGRQVVLSQNNGGGGDNFGTGGLTCATTTAFTVFDDEAGTPIGAGAPPFAGSFIPDNALSLYDGRGMNGTWTFQSDDQAPVDSGTLGCVRLNIVNSEFVARAAVFARPAVVEVEFTNFRFNPTTLKVCKIGATPAVVGQSFDFTVALVSPVSQPGNVPLFPPFSQAVSVIAGPPGPQGGNCTFVNGGALLGGAFNQGSTITITENAPASTVTDISCGSCGPGGLAVSLPTRQATLSGPNGLVAGVNAVTFTNTIPLPPQERAVRYDFDGDRKADPAAFAPASGTWKVALSSYGGAQRNTPFGQAGDKLVPADYDGDGQTDYAVWRPSTGQWFFNTGTRYEYHQWGEAGDIPQVGDFDGDGKADFVVFRPSNGTWYEKHMNGTFKIYQFGITTDRPAAADYDGDGMTDAGVFRNGTWYTLNSNQGFRITNFGQTGDVPVPGDYDGDGAADIAVYRNGTWFKLSATTYTVNDLGTATDVPVPADYDGDGKFDLAIFRPTEGKWYIRRSSLGESGTAAEISLGSASDALIQGPQ